MPCESGKHPQIWRIITCSMAYRSSPKNWSCCSTWSIHGVSESKFKEHEARRGHRLRQEKKRIVLTHPWTFPTRRSCLSSKSKNIQVVHRGHNHIQTEQEVLHCWSRWPWIPQKQKIHQTCSNHLHVWAKRTVPKWWFPKRRPPKTPLPKRLLPD